MNSIASPTKGDAELATLLSEHTSSLYHAPLHGAEKFLSALSRRGVTTIPVGAERAAAWAAAGHAHVGGLACCAVVDAAGALLAAPALRHATRSSRPLLLLCIAEQDAAAAVVAQLAADRVAPTTVHAASGAELGAAVARAAAAAAAGPVVLVVPALVLHTFHTAAGATPPPANGNGHHHQNGNGHHHQNGNGVHTPSVAAPSFPSPPASGAPAPAALRALDRALGGGATYYVAHAAAAADARALRAARLPPARTVEIDGEGADGVAFAVGVAAAAAAAAHGKGSGGRRAAAATAVCVLCASSVAAAAAHEIAIACRLGLPLVLLARRDPIPLGTPTKAGSEEAEGKALTALAEAVGCGCRRRRADEPAAAAVGWAAKRVAVSQPSLLLDWCEGPADDDVATPSGVTNGTPVVVVGTPASPPRTPVRSPPERAPRTPWSGVGSPPTPRTPWEPPPYHCDLWRVLAESAARHGAHAAVTQGDDIQLTYVEVLGRAVSLAAWLQQEGMRRGDRLGLLAGNRWEVFVAHYAAAALRVVLLNLNTRLAPPELAYIIDDAEPTFVIAEDGLAPPLRQAIPLLRRPPPALVWVACGAPPAEPAPPPAREARFSAALEAGAALARGFSPPPLLEASEGYQMYYTSGTSGFPKGVVLSYANVSAHAHAAITEFGFGPSDAWGHFAPMYHLVDAYAIYALTWVGGSHALLPTWETQAALRVMANCRLSATHVAATMLQMLLTNPLRPTLDLSALRMISCGGSALPTALVAQAFEAFGAAFFTSYGMTECCGKISVSRLGPSELRLPHSEQLRLVGSQGKPFTGMEVRVTAADSGADAAAGEVGEVRIRGPTVLSEYWRRPEASAEALVGGWFRTGDLGVLDSRGWLTLVDRAKDMILFAGENVYSAEVERVVASHAAVHLAAVYGVPDPSGQFGELVKAVVQLKDGAALTRRELQTHCASHLARYKVPAVVEFVALIPLTGSGKVHKSVLKERETRLKPAAAAAVVAVVPSPRPPAAPPTAPTRPSRAAAAAAAAPSAAAPAKLAHASMLWNVEWRPRAPPPRTAAAAAAEAGGRWLLFAAGAPPPSSASGVSDDEVMVAELRRLVERRGDSLTVVAPAAAGAPLTVEAVEAALRGGGGRWRGVAILCPLQCADPLAPEATRRCVRSLWAVSKAAAAAALGCPLHLFTRGAHAALPSDPPCRPDHTPAWGWARALAREMTQPVRRVDLCPKAPPAHGARQLLDQLLLPPPAAAPASPPDDEVAVRGTRVLAPRLAAWTPPPQLAAAAFDGGKTYVVSGALGGVGMHVTRWLLRRGARHLVLLTRSQRTADARAVDLERLRVAHGGARIEVRLVDVASEAAVRRLLSEVAAGWPPCDGILHLAGGLDDGLAKDLAWDRCEAVLGAKVYGALHLHTIASELALPLSHFVLFSSVYALLGYAQLTHYAAANIALDGLAAHRRQLGLPATCINWGLWRDPQSMAPQSAGFVRLWRSQGMEYLDPEDGIAAMELLMAAPPSSTPSSVGAFPVTSWASFSSSRAAPSTALVADVTAAAAAAPPAAASTTAAAAPPPPPSADALLQIVLQTFAAVTGDAPPAPTDSLVAAGIDSLASVDFGEQLSERLGGVSLPGSLVFDYPTASDIARFLQTLAPSAPAPAAPASVAVAAPAVAPASTAVAPASAAALLDAVLQTFAAVTGEAPPAPTDSLVASGIDSLASVDFGEQLSERLGGVSLPGSLVFDYPTATDVVRFLQTLGVAAAPSVGTAAAIASPAAPLATPLAPPPAARDDIAVLSTACRAPPSHESLAPFWAALCNREVAVHDVPPERWDAATYVNTDVSAARRGYTYTSAGSWLSGADAFDFGFFGVAKAEAAGMDPKQRLLLEVGYEVLHGAGMTKATAMGADVGVFVGMCSQDWQLISQHHRVSPYTGTGCHGPSIAANRLSYALGLRGPSFVVDTACSSSLVAADCALDKLHAKSVGSVIVAGVNLNLTPHLYVAFANAHMLSPSGRNATFDASADGYVRGEGCLALLLEPRAAGTQQLSVVGSAINQDGRSATLTAPNGPAQQRCVRAALASAGVGTAAIAYVEAHGSATPLGDVIEIEALGAVMSAGGQRPGRALPLGSGKTCVGHLEGAAGVLGLCKAAASLLQRRDAPLGLLQRLNASFNVVKEKSFAAAFPSQILPLAPTDGDGDGAAPHSGTSSFGFGGTNAHTILRLSGVPQRPEACAESLRPAAPPAFRRTSLPWGTASMAAPGAPAQRVAAAAVASPPPRATPPVAARVTPPVASPPAPAAEEDDDAVFEMVWAPRAAAVATAAAAPPPFATLLRPSSADLAEGGVRSASLRTALLNLAAIALLCDGGESAEELVVAALELVKAATAARGPAGMPALVLITRGSQPAGGVGAVTDANAGALWGFGRSARLEFARLRLTCVDLPAATAADDEVSVAAAVASLLRAADGEAEVALSAAGVPHVHRLRRSSRRLGRIEAMPGTHEGTQLVSGGMGGLGLLCARWLADAHADKIVLASRSGRAAADSMSEWRRLASRRGVAVTAIRCDVGSPSDVARMALALWKTPIRTVVHSAGVLDDALLANQSAASIRRVFAPKVGGAWLLHAATLAQTEPLDAFVVFSSVASSLGGAGQTNYAAANASLDALTALRQAEGAAGSIALQWGAVSGVGMGAATGADVQLQRRGLPAVSADMVCAALGAALEGPRPPPVALSVVAADWARYRKWAPASFAPYLSEVTSAPSAPSPAAEPAAVSTTSLASLASEDDTPLWLRSAEAILSPAPRPAAARVTAAASVPAPASGKALDIVVKASEEILGGTIDPHLTFMELGMDSLTLIELSNSLEGELGLSLGSTATIDHPTPAALAAHIAPQLGAAPAAAGGSAALDIVVRASEEILGGSIDPHLTFMELGMDSLTLIELSNSLEGELGLSLGSTATIDHPTPAALAAHIAPQLASAAGAAAAAPMPLFAPMPAAAASADAPVVVGGSSVYLPGGVRNIDGLWRMLCECPDTRREIPDSRFDVKAMYDPKVGTAGKTYSKMAHLLDGLSLFDARMFGISPGESAGMDPQQRLLLEGSFEAATAAGYDKGSMNGAAIGTFVGLGNNDWAHMAASRQDATTTLTGHSPSVASGRIAFHLGFVGPAVTVDTACSSALVALDHATTAVRLGRVEAAVCAGVNALLLGRRFIELSAAHMLSESERCRPFDAAADGYVRGEGCAAVCVQPLSAAPDAHSSVIGLAINQDGHSLSLVAPSGPQQQSVIALALRAAGVAPAAYAFTEANSTGGKLGDAVEAGGLKGVFGGAFTPEGGRSLAVGAGKGLYGNLESAVGAASLLKAMLTLRHRAATPNPFPVTLSPQVAANTAGFAVGIARTETVALGGDGTAPTGGVCAYGFSGTNVHAVLRDTYAPPAVGFASPLVGSLKPSTVAFSRTAFEWNKSDMSAAARIINQWEKATPAPATSMSPAQVQETIRLCVLGNLAPGTPLGADRLTTSFRDLGCNSLSIMQIISNVNARFKTTLTMQQALSDVGGSVAAVASLVSAQIEAERALDSIAPEAEVRREVVAAIVENLPSGASVSEGDHGKTLLQLGATSMAIMQTLSQVNTRFGTELTLRQVMAFSGPNTIDAFVHIIMERQRSALPPAKRPDLPTVTAADEAIKMTARRRRRGAGAADSDGDSDGGSDASSAATSAVADDGAGAGGGAVVAGDDDVDGDGYFDGDEGGAVRLRVTDDELLLPSAQQFALLKTIVRNKDMEREHTYGYCVGVSVGGDLRLPLLRIALATLFRRHASLRTRFDADTYYQIIAPPSHFPQSAWLSEHDVREEADAEAAAHGYMLAEARRPMDPFVGPLFRTLVVRLPAEQTALILNFHHLIDDGGSVGIFLDELWLLYTTLVEGRCAADDAESALRPTLPYTAYIARQRDELARGMAGQYAHWELRYGASAVPLPVLRMQFAKPPAELKEDNRMIGMAPLAVPLPLVAKIHRVAQAAGVTVNTAMLAAYLLLCGRYVATEPERIACIIAFNDRQDAEMQTIGFSTNLVMVDAQLDGTLSYVELAQQVHSSVLFAIANSGAFFPLMWKHWKKSSRRARMCYFNVESNWRAGAVGSGADALEVEPLEAPSRRNIFDLELKLELKQSSAGFVGAIEYDQLVYDAAMMESFASHFVALLDRLTSTPDAVAWRVPFVRRDERARAIRFARGGGRADAPSLAAVLDPAVAAFGRSGFEAAAVAAGAVELSAKELRDASRALAAVLLGRCALAAGGRVGLCLDEPHAAAAVVGALGILMAGGVIVAVDADAAANPQAERVDAAVAVCSQAAGVASRRWLHESVHGAVGCILLTPAGALLDASPPPDLSLLDSKAAALAPERPVALLPAAAAGGSSGGYALTRLHALANSVGGLLAAAPMAAGAPVVLVGTPRDAHWLQVALAALVSGAPLRLASATQLRAAGGWPAAEPAPTWLACATRDLPSLPPEGAAALRTVVGSCDAGDANGLSLQQLRAWAAGGRTVLCGYQVAPVGLVGIADLSAALGTMESRHVSLANMGVPLPNVRAHIVDPAGAPTPLGATGRLCVALPHLRAEHADAPHRFFDATSLNDAAGADDGDDGSDGGGGDEFGWLLDSGALGQWMPDGSINLHDDAEDARLRRASAAGPVVPPRTAVETWLVEFVQHEMQIDELSVTASLFEELGVDSMKRLTLIGAIRRTLGVNVTIAELEWDSVRDLATRIEMKRDLATTDVDAEGLRLQGRLPPLVGSPLPRGRRLAAQLGGIVLVCTVRTLSVGPFAAAALALLRRATVASVVLLLPVALAAQLIFTVLLGIVLKWIIVGRLKVGAHPLWSWPFLRWWLAQRATAPALEVLHHARGSPLANLAWRLLGARVGAGAVVDTVGISEADLVEIGETALIGDGARLCAHRFVPGAIVFGRVQVGAGAVVNPHAAVMADSVVGAGAELGPQSLLASAQTVPPNAYWEGAPARAAERPERAGAHWVVRPPAGLEGAMLLALGALYMLGVATLTLAPAALLLHHLPLVPAAAIALQTLPALHLALCVASQRLLVGHVPPGRRRPTAAQAAACWTADRLLRGPLFGASLALWRGAIVPTYRYLGLRVGHGAALSALQLGCDAHLVEIGAGALVGAGAAALPRLQLRDGSVVWRRIAVRPHAKLCENVLLLGGSTVGEYSTLGALTVAAPHVRFVADSAWVGSPPQLRDSGLERYFDSLLSTAKGEQMTLFGSPMGRPDVKAPPTSALRSLEGGAAEGGEAPAALSDVAAAALEASAAAAATTTQLLSLLCVCYPSARVLYAAHGAAAAALAAGTNASLALLALGALLLPPALLAILLVSSALAVRLVRASAPLHRRLDGVGGSELAPRLIGGLLAFCPSSLIGGSDILVWWWRAAGGHVGADAYVDAHPPATLDALAIGDGAVVSGGVIFSHEPPAEGEKRKAHRGVVVGRRAVVAGPLVAVQPGAVVGEGTVLTPLTLVDNHEVLPPTSLWTGSPAEKVCTLPDPFVLRDARGAEEKKRA